MKVGENDGFVKWRLMNTGMFKKQRNSWELSGMEW